MKFSRSPPPAKVGKFHTAFIVAPLPYWECADGHRVRLPARVGNPIWTAFTQAKLKNATALALLTHKSSAEKPAQNFWREHCACAIAGFERICPACPITLVAMWRSVRRPAGSAATRSAVTRWRSRALGGRPAPAEVHPAAVPGRRVLL